MGLFDEVDSEVDYQKALRLEEVPVRMEDVDGVAVMVMFLDDLDANMCTVGYVAEHVLASKILNPKITNILLVGSYLETFQSREDFEDSTAELNGLCLDDYSTTAKNHSIREIDAQAQDIVNVMIDGILERAQLSALKKLDNAKRKLFKRLENFKEVTDFPRVDGLIHIDWMNALPVQIE